MDYFAHSANPAGICQSLAEHLRNVASIASRFAESFDLVEEAKLIGLLHDIGKYGDSFQRRLLGLEKGLDHWSNGAWIGLQSFHAITAAVATQGHHIGLQAANIDALRCIDPRRLATNHPQGLVPTETDCQKLIDRLQADGLSLPGPREHSIQRMTETASAMLDVRMLFSTLVDADFLDTEAHFNTGSGKTIRTAGPLLVPETACPTLFRHIQTVRRSSESSEHINELRDALLADCINAAQNSVGLWTLTAPTGAGKTLAMLAFALRHAEVNGLRRIVIVIPYLSIIEQTARICREVFESSFGQEFVLEDHSLTETCDGDNIRLLAQNWDAPVIITTSVQMLESLFSNRPSACRKLHRLAKSVILFDEVQSLPSHLAVPTLAVLSHLSQRYGTSVVFSTATQPAFSHLDDRVREINGSTPGWQPREIVPKPADLFGRARRTRVVWPEEDANVSWPELAQTLSEQNQALCILNLKRHTRELMFELSELKTSGVFHLSTSMCPAHRREVLDKVRKHLKGDKKCLLVSTQCVEAGVDVDFPIVYRAFADLPSIAQAAGRCNRNDRLEVGNVYVFAPNDERYPRGGYYEQAAQVTKLLLARDGPKAMDINDPSLFEDYYRMFYDLVSPHNQKKFHEIHEAIVRQDFRDVAKLYKLIEQDTVNLLVSYDMNHYESLVEEVREKGLTSDWVRRARPFSVSIYRPKEGDVVLERLEQVRVGRSELADDWFIYLDPNDYRNDQGLVPPNGPSLWIA